MLAAVALLVPSFAHTGTLNDISQIRPAVVGSRGPQPQFVPIPEALLGPRDAGAFAYPAEGHIFARQQLHQRDLVERSFIKRELATRDVHEILAREPDVTVMVREIGNFLTQFSKRDGSPITARDVSLVTRDINRLASRKLHIASPHEIKVKFQEAGKKMGQGFKTAGKWLHDKAGPWLKNHALDIASGIVTAIPVPGMAAAGVAMKVASGVKTAVTIAKNAAKAAKTAVDIKGKVDNAKAAVNNAKGKGKGKREAAPSPFAEDMDLYTRDADPEVADFQLFARHASPEATASAAASAIAESMAELETREIFSHINSILARHDIVARDPDMLFERFVDTASKIAGHVFKREAAADPVAMASLGGFESLFER